jgi:hypothetical protein
MHDFRFQDHRLFFSDYHRISASTRVPCANQLIVPILYQWLTCEQVMPAKK